MNAQQVFDGIRHENDGRIWLRNDELDAAAVMSTLELGSQVASAHDASSTNAIEQSEAQ